MRELYAPIEPYVTGRLQVSRMHNMYYEECGNTHGTPVVFLHGGPGSGLATDHRRFFNPLAYRIVLFDQRGSGHSTPHGCLEDNTTWDLVADIERLREHLGIERWVVFGGSWGSTLALAYAETHPARVRALVLRGIFLGRQSDNDWIYQSGTNAIFPDVWEAFVHVIPEAERGNLVGAYYKRLTSDDEHVSHEAARAWRISEGSASKLLPDPTLRERVGEAALAWAPARIECHYFINHFFLPSDNYLLEHVSNIRHIPTVIVQGRYDVLCPMTGAWELHNAFPEAELVIVPDAGHSASEKGMLSALVEATDRFRDAL